MTTIQITTKNRIDIVDITSQVQTIVKNSGISDGIVTILENGRIVLGTWQNIYFMEYDGPRNRKAHIKIIKG